MIPDDQSFERAAQSIRALSGREIDELLARSTHVVSNAICITDADLDEPGPRIVYVNPAFEAITGYTHDEVVGRNPRFLQGPLTDRTVTDRLRSDLVAGRPFQGETWNYRKDATAFRVAWRIAALRDEDGRITHYVAAQDDVTALRQAEQTLRDQAELLQAESDWLEALVALGVTTGRASEPDAVLRQVLDASVGPLGADDAAIVLVDDDRSAWVVVRAHEAVAAMDGMRFDPQPGTLIAQALDGHRPVVSSGDSPPVGAGLGLTEGATAVLPIGEPGTSAYGALVLAWRSPQDLRPVEQAHLAMLARLITMTHRNTQAMESQRWLASELQAALLPDLGEHEGLDVAWRYLSVDDDTVIGGDWYDVVSLGHGDVAVFVGDVVGHGAGAAALMGEIRYTVRGLLRSFTDPGALLDELDASLLADHQPGMAMATVCAVCIDRDGTLRYSSAGHPSPVVRRTGGSVDVLDGARSRPVGVTAGGTARPTEVACLYDGDTLVAFSDGVFENRDQSYDDAYLALLRRLAASADDPDGLCDAAVGFVNVGDDRPGFRDDVVVLAVRSRPAGRSGDDSSG